MGVPAGGARLGKSLKRPRASPRGKTLVKAATFGLRRVADPTGHFGAGSSRAARLFVLHQGCSPCRPRPATPAKGKSRTGWPRSTPFSRPSLVDREPAAIQVPAELLDADPGSGPQRSRGYERRISRDRGSPWPAATTRNLSCGCGPPRASAARRGPGGCLHARACCSRGRYPQGELAIQELDDARSNISGTADCSHPSYAHRPKPGTVSEGGRQNHERARAPRARPC